MTEWYRFEDLPTEGGGHKIVLCTYRVLKETPRGVWIGDGSRKRFVLNDARKRYAYPTQAEAWESLRARRRRELAIITHRLEFVRNVLDDLKNGVPADVPIYSFGHWRFE